MKNTKETKTKEKKVQKSVSKKEAPASQGVQVKPINTSKKLSKEKQELLAKLGIGLTERGTYAFEFKMQFEVAEDSMQTEDVPMIKQFMNVMLRDMRERQFAEMSRLYNLINDVPVPTVKPAVKTTAKK